MSTANNPTLERALIAGLALVLCACRVAGEKAPPSTPAWLDALIDQIAAQPLTDPPSEVLAYRYREQTVFYRPPYCCDIQGVVYDQAGKVLCYPTGGFTGHGDGRCSDFAALRSDCQRLWRDPRAKASADPPCPVDTRPESSLQ